MALVKKSKEDFSVLTKENHENLKTFDEDNEVIDFERKLADMLEDF